jgi:thioredoxin-dependent peroxiredoxin
MRRLTASICLGGLAALAVALPLASAQEKGKAKGSPSVKVGDRAPAFTSVDDRGQPFKSSEVVGKTTVVVYFFPAALTGG